MTAGERLARVLERHHGDAWNHAQTRCCGEWRWHQQHSDHLTAAVLDHLAAELGSVRLRGMVARAIHGNTIGDPAKGEPMVIWDRPTNEIIRDADAALGAVRAALGVSEA